MSATGLRVEGLTCQAGDRPLFAQVSFDVSAGQWLMLTGTNGSGKTTLLRAVAGLIRPVAGSVQWCGESRQASDPLWHSRFIYQGHAAGWKDAWSAHENLASQGALDRGRSIDAAEIDRLLERVGLGHRRDVAFASLSAGQRRRVGVARLLNCPRPLWLLDEPATALDRDGQQLLAEVIDAHLAGGGCAVIATHQLMPLQQAPLLLDLDAPDARSRPSSVEPRR